MASKRGLQAATLLHRFLVAQTPTTSLALQQHRLLTAASSSSAIACSVLRAREQLTLNSALAKLPQQWRRLEQRTAAVATALSQSNSCLMLLPLVIPVTALATLWPGNFHANAISPPPTRDLHPQAPSPTSPPRSHLASLLAHSLSALLTEIRIFLRGCYLIALFTPALASALPAFWLGHHWRASWMHLIVWTLERAGPAYIKWGQWSSTRPDLFPPDLCAALEQLQTQAPAHPPAVSRATVEASLGYPVHTLFDAFEDTPVASGSIAQIHRAKLSAAGAALVARGAAGGGGGQPGKGLQQMFRRRGALQPGTMVAVKVRHPGISRVMHHDFILMQRAVRLASQLPGLAALRLEESVRQFGGPLKEQLDLALEAANLTRFKRNFRLWPNVSFPTPIYPLVASDVLVESFEDGTLISRFLNQPTYKYRNLLAETGLTCYLQMLLQDNFIHADLHPGNLLVREVDTRSAMGGGWAGWLSAGVMRFSPQLVLLDTGMIAELSKPDQTGLVAFFRALTKQDGEGLGRAILDMSERHTCKNPDAFVTALASMFNALDPEYIHHNTSSVISDIIDTLRSHQVTLKSTVSTVVVTTLVLEGWSSKLNPEMRILDHIRDVLLVDWRDRISRTVDKIMSSGSVAVA